MSELNLEEMTNEELHEAIKKGVYADQFLNSDIGQMLKEAGKRIVDKVDRQLTYNGIDLIDKGQNAKLIELLIVKEKWQYGFLNEIDLLVEDGEAAYDEVQNRRESDTISEFVHRT